MFSYELNESANNYEQHLVTAQLIKSEGSVLVIYKGPSELVAKSIADVLNHLTDDKNLLESGLMSYKVNFAHIKHIMFDYETSPETIAYCNFCETVTEDSNNYCPKCGYALDFFKRIPVEKSTRN